MVRNMRYELGQKSLPLTQKNTMTFIDENTYELNIQPAASIMNVFSRLSYKPWYAIAEFVDNSTQSYISNIEKLNSNPAFEKLVIKVSYDTNLNTLTITDNAFGMEIDKFKNAILLDSKNSEQTGRNEFGMGLKTAASWFGNIWTIISTQYGSPNKFRATVNISELKENGLNSIQISRESVSENDHGTTVLIKDVTKKITGHRTIGKIRDLLSSMYRRDINNRNIEIWFNNEPIEFADYPILENFRGKKWKKTLNFKVNFNELTYHVTGFVAIMNPGSFPKSGFALFRQDRVVVGGTDLNYKPTQIFGQAQSQRSLKLFGELNMNDFPVNQAKDGFIWDDGLEDAFIDALKSNIQEYIDIADISIKERAHETQYSEEKSLELNKEVSKIVSTMTREEPLNTGKEHHPSNSHFSDTQEYIETILKAEEKEQLVGTNRHYDIPVNNVQELKINVQWSIGKRNYWINYHDNPSGGIDVHINIDHPFFIPYSKDEDFKKVLEKFVLAFVVAEQQAKLTSDKDGYILANTIKNNMNRYLSKMAEE